MRVVDGSVGISCGEMEVFLWSSHKRRVFQKIFLSFWSPPAQPRHTAVRVARKTVDLCDIPKSA